MLSPLDRPTHTALALILAVTCVMSDALAQAPSKPGKWSYEVSVSPYHQPSVDIDGGGAFKLSSAFLRFDVKRVVSSTTTIGLGLKYDIDDYDFSNEITLGGTQPWNDVRRFGLSIPIFTRLQNNWSFGAVPSVDWLQEEGADNSDSLAYGMTAFVLKSFSRDKSIGFGAGVFREIDDDTEVFPYIAVDWRFNARWRVANPFQAEALGPAGLELIYSFNERWHLGGGGVYRAFRFRLDDTGIAPNGIGENEGVIAFLRLRRLAPAGINVDFYAGAMVDGRVQLKDRNGSGLASADYDPAPFAAVTFRLSF